MGKFCHLLWYVPFRSDVKLMAAFHAGLVTALILMLGVALPLSYMTYTDQVSPGNLKAAFNLRGFQQKWSVLEEKSSIDVSDRESAKPRELQVEDVVGEAAYGEVPRRFLPLGAAHVLFGHFATYRTGPKSFAVLGLGPRLMHKFWSKPGFQCFWDSNNSSSSTVQLLDGNHETLIEGTATNYYPQEMEIATTAEYVTVVVYCTFDCPVGVDGKGGELRMVANHGEYRKHTVFGSHNVEFVALSEKAEASDATLFEAPFKYEYLYCGGPLYGEVNPHRLREWLAYHMRLFGLDSHFIFYDNGGINDDSWKFLEPWVKLGRLTIMNVRQEQRYDTYYHAQFLYTNDCLLRGKSMAKWAFFFDVDEYLHVSESPLLEESFHKIMSEISERGRRATSILLQQRLMSPVHCSKNLTSPNGQNRQWAIEKLVYRRTPDRSELFEGTGSWTYLDNYKSAVQPRYVLVMGVHDPGEVEVPPDNADTCTLLNVHFEGCLTCFDDKLHYYHYHGTTSMNQELCQETVDPHRPDATIELGGAKHILDDSMDQLAITVKEYEFKTLGNVQL